jgi:hypothetical protein
MKIMNGMGLLLLSGAAVAQDDSLAELVARHSHPMTAELAGPGGELLVEAAAGAHFVLVGESHGNRETPRLTSALLSKLQPAGYGALAVEVSPFAAEVLVELASEEDGRGALTYQFSEYPWFAPFFNWREEAELLVGAVGAGVRVVGLDQEFMGSGPYYLDRLRASAPGAEALALVDGWRAAEGDDPRAATFLSKAKAEDFDALERAFKGSGAEVQRILGEMRESVAIYALYNEGRNYASNRRRIQLMKSNMDRALRQPDLADTKMILKFGSMHTGRGYSALNQLDLGNHAAELGYAAGGGSLHLYLTCVEQRQNDGSVTAFLEQVPHLEPLYANVGAEGWTVVDLRALRPYFHERERDELADVVWRHDLLLLQLQFQQATALVE